MNKRSQEKVKHLQQLCLAVIANIKYMTSLEFWPDGGATKEVGGFVTLWSAAGASEKGRGSGKTVKWISSGCDKCPYKTSSGYFSLN